MKSENEIQQLIRLEAAKYGVILWRNNSGVLEDVDGRPVRFGLANESRKLNLTFKSSDLIGVHQVSGKFVAIECKPEGWKYKGDRREKAQKAFIDFLNAHGSIAGFAQSVEDFLRIIGVK